MFCAKSVPLLLGTLVLSACAVAPPTGPTVLVLPPAGKDLAQFQQDDSTCRGYAVQQIGYGSPQQAANQSAIGSAAVGTVVGAGAGAAIGATAGNPGAGAAVGAATGLVAGSAVGAGNASASAAELQQRYNVSYAQCMAARGDQPQPFPMAGTYGYYGYPYGYYPYAYTAYYDDGFGPALGFGVFGGDHFHGHGHGFGGHGGHDGHGGHRG
jgi:Glycine-zipper domain